MRKGLELVQNATKKILSTLFSYFKQGTKEDYKAQLQQMAEEHTAE
jgi:hypothetical protein